MCRHPRNLRPAKYPARPQKVTEQAGHRDGCHQRAAERRHTCLMSRADFAPCNHHRRSHQHEAARSEWRHSPRMRRSRQQGSRPQHQINPEIKPEDVFQQRQQTQASRNQSAKLSPVFPADTKQHSQAAQDEPQSSVALHRGKRGRNLDENCLMPMPSSQHGKPNYDVDCAAEGKPSQFPASARAFRGSGGVRKPHATIIGKPAFFITLERWPTRN